MGVSWERFAQDHWQLLFHLEKCIVHEDGYADVHEGRYGGGGGDPQITLRDGTLRAYRDDAGGVQDLEDAGLVTDREPGVGRKGPRFALTSRGWDVAGALRKHLGQGGSFAAFQFTPRWPHP